MQARRAQVKSVNSLGFSGTTGVHNRPLRKRAASSTAVRMTPVTTSATSDHAFLMLLPLVPSMVGVGDLAPDVEASGAAPNMAMTSLTPVGNGADSPSRDASAEGPPATKPHSSSTRLPATHTRGPALARGPGESNRRAAPRPPGADVAKARAVWPCGTCPLGVVTSPPRGAFRIPRTDSRVLEGCSRRVGSQQHGRGHMGLPRLVPT
jgi:hypothetical protein